MTSGFPNPLHDHEFPDERDLADFGESAPDDSFQTVVQAENPPQSYWTPARMLHLIFAVVYILPIIALILYLIVHY